MKIWFFIVVPLDSVNVSYMKMRLELEGVKLSGEC